MPEWDSDFKHSEWEDDSHMGSDCSCENRKSNECKDITVWHLVVKLEDKC